MGHGSAPAGIDLDTSAPMDRGTWPRTDSPPPAPIGLDAKSGDASQSAAGIADQIVGYARRQRGARVGNGQCFDLADTALRGAGARAPQTTARSRRTPTTRGAHRSPSQRCSRAT